VWGRFVTLADLAAVPDSDNQHQQDVVVDLVDDAVVPAADATFAVATDQFHGAAGSGVVGQQLEGGLQPATRSGVQLAELSQRRQSNRDRELMPGRGQP
jgi:hypothetical protein